VLLGVAEGGATGSGPSESSYSNYGISCGVEWKAVDHLKRALECIGEYSATARPAAVTRVRGGANLNCTFQIWAIFSHSCTAYRQLKFCFQSLFRWAL
jgi:hypothetical protein